MHERVESARRRTGPVPILGHGSRLGTEELGLLAKAERDKERWLTQFANAKLFVETGGR